MLTRKYGRARARSQLLRNNPKNKINKNLVESNSCLKNTVEIPSNEKEYNDKNLFFYCKYFDAKTKSIKKLPKNHIDLSSKHLICIKKAA